MWDLPAEIQITGDEHIYCRENDTETARFYNKAGIPIRYVSAPTAPSRIYRIGLWFEPGKLSFIESRAADIVGHIAEVTSGGPGFLDVLPKGVSKGNALEYFVSTMPSRPDIIVAAGDHDNDLTMLRYADIAAVPGNGAENLFSVADIIIPKAAEHGVSALINHMLSPNFPRTRAEIIPNRDKPLTL